MALFFAACPGLAITFVPSLAPEPISSDSHIYQRPAEAPSLVGLSNFWSFHSHYSHCWISGTVECPVISMNSLCVCVCMCRGWGEIHSVSSVTLKNPNIWLPIILGLLKVWRFHWYLNQWNISHANMLLLTCFTNWAKGLSRKNLDSSNQEISSANYQVKWTINSSWSPPSCFTL